MLRVPKYPPSQMKCPFLSLRQLFGALRQYFCSKMGENFSDFTASNPDEKKKKKKPLPLFQSISLPLSFSAECQVSLGLFFFCLISMSMLFQSCVSGSHCLCLTGRLSKNHGHTCWKEKEESAVFYGREREREKKEAEAATASLPHLSVGVYVRVHVWVCVSLCQ